MEKRFSASRLGACIMLGAAFGALLAAIIACGIGGYYALWAVSAIARALLAGGV